MLSALRARQRAILAELAELDHQIEYDYPSRATLLCCHGLHASFSYAGTIEMSSIPYDFMFHWLDDSHIIIEVGPGVNSPNPHHVQAELPESARNPAVRVHVYVFSLLLLCSFHLFKIVHVG